MSSDDDLKTLEADLEKKKKEVAELEKKIQALKEKSGEKPTKSILGVPLEGDTAKQKKKVVLQKIPTSGTSQIKFRETQYECPQCSSKYNTEIDDKQKILYIDGAGTRIYGKKHRCLNCGNEFL